MLLDVSAHAKFFEIPNRKMLMTEPASPTRITGLLPARSELQKELNTDGHPCGMRDKQSTPLKDSAALSYSEGRILLDGVIQDLDSSGGKVLTTRPE
jgi:hypothetical protein